jgi:hypothetical protein
MADSSFFKDGGTDSGTFASIDSSLADAEASKVAAEAAQVAAEQASTNAAASEAQVASDASDANISKIAASQSALSASFSEQDAKKFAVNPVDQSFTTDLGNSGPFFSSLHYSEKAEDSKVLAAASETAAFDSAADAAASETAAADSVTAAADSETNAAASETNAAASETNAAQSEQDANIHKMNAQIAENNANSYSALAQSYRNQAEDHRDDAAKLAIEPEDSQYTLDDGTTQGYSALHYAAKAESDMLSAETFSLNAQTSKTNAQNAQNAALVSEGNAAAAQTGAEAARDATLAALDSFDDRYLGVKSSDPTVDNDGDPLQSGQLYFNSTSQSMKVYDGSNWLAAYSSLSGALLAANNLNDLNNAATARTNLGLAAVASSGDLLDLGITDGTNSQVLTTDGSGTFTFADAPSGDLVDDTTPQLGGDLETNSNHIKFTDGDKAIFGSGSDLQIYHDGSNSYIHEVGAGDLTLLVNDFELKSTYQNRYMIRGSSTQVSLWCNNFPKLETQTTGIKVYGRVDCDEVSTTGNLSSSGTMTLNSGSNQIYLGADGAIELTRAAGGAYIDFKDSKTEDFDARLSVSGSELQANGHKIWHAGNDGTNSGLDADTLDGYHASNFALSGNGIISSPTVVGDLNVDNGTFFVDASSNRVGIGLGLDANGNPVTPSMGTEIKGSVRFTSTLGAGHGLDLQNTSTVAKFYRPNGSLRLQAGASSRPELRLENNGDLKYGTRFTIKESDGPILVGTNSVSNRLSTSSVYSQDRNKTGLQVDGPIRTHDAYVYDQNGSNTGWVFDNTPSRGFMHQSTSDANDSLGTVSFTKRFNGGSSGGTFNVCDVGSNYGWQSGWFIVEVFSDYYYKSGYKLYAIHSGYAPSFTHYSNYNHGSHFASLSRTLLGPYMDTTTNISSSTVNGSYYLSRITATISAYGAVNVKITCDESHQIRSFLTDDKHLRLY